MKRMRFKTFLPITIIATALLFLPLIASAETITWTSESYNAYASVGGTIDEKNGPPLPITAYAQESGYFCPFGLPCFPWSQYASSNITSSTISVLVSFAGESGNVGSYRYASGDFSGTFTASYPVFQFSYDYNYSYSEVFNGEDWGQKIWINIDDLTSSTNLYNGTLDSSYLYLNNIGGDTISLTTPIGHEINVSFGATVDGGPTHEYSQINMTYNMTSVVPEPISSILFVTGGAVLAGRRFLRRSERGHR